MVLWSIMLNVDSSRSILTINKDAIDKVDHIESAPVAFTFSTANVTSYLAAAYLFY